MTEQDKQMDRLAKEQLARIEKEEKPIRVPIDRTDMSDALCVDIYSVDCPKCGTIVDLGDDPRPRVVRCEAQSLTRECGTLIEAFWIVRGRK